MKRMSTICFLSSLSLSVSGAALLCVYLLGVVWNSFYVFPVCNMFQEMPTLLSAYFFAMSCPNLTFGCQKWVDSIPVQCKICLCLVAQCWKKLPLYTWPLFSKVPMASVIHSLYIICTHRCPTIVLWQILVPIEKYAVAGHLSVVLAGLACKKRVGKVLINNCCSPFL